MPRPAGTGRLLLLLRLPEAIYNLDPVPAFDPCLDINREEMPLSSGQDYQVSCPVCITDERGKTSASCGWAWMITSTKLPGRKRRLVLLSVTLR